jgi:membrane protein
VEFLQRARRKLVADRVSGLAAEVAFWAVLSVVPAVLVLTSLVGLVGSAFGEDVSQRVEQQLVEVVDGTSPAGPDGLARSVTDLFDEPRPGVFSVALVVTLWAASRAAALLVGALDVINGSGRQRSWVNRRLWGLGVALGSVVVVTAVLVVFALAPAFVAGVWAVVAWALVAVAWITAVFTVASASALGWRHHVVGAAVAVGLAAVFTAGFRIYLGVQAGNVILFGLGGVLVALLWLYLLGLGVLVGAVVNVLRSPYAGGHDHDGFESARP